MKFHQYITANTLSTDEAINAETSNNYLNSSYGNSEMVREKDPLVFGVCHLALLNVRRTLTLKKYVVSREKCTIG